MLLLCIEASLSQPVSQRILIDFLQVTVPVICVNFRKQFGTPDRIED